MKDLIAKCLEIDEEKRIGWDKLLKHDIIAKINLSKNLVRYIF